MPELSHERSREFVRRCICNSRMSDDSSADDDIYNHIRQYVRELGDSPPGIVEPGTPPNFGLTLHFVPPVHFTPRIWPKTPCTEADHRWFYMSQVNLPDDIAFGHTATHMPAYHTARRTKFTSSIICIRCGLRCECDPEEAREKVLDSNKKVM